MSEEATRKEKGQTSVKNAPKEKPLPGGMLAQ